MNRWIMDKLFQGAVARGSYSATSMSKGYLSVKACQTRLMESVRFEEGEKKKVFEVQMKEAKAEDLLDKATHRAKLNLMSGNIAKPEYYTILERIDTLRKLQFAEDSRWQDYSCNDEAF